MVCFWCLFACHYGHLPSLTGDFVKMYMMVIDIFCYLIAVCSVELMAFLFSTFASLLLYFNEKKPLSCTSELRTAVMYKLCYYMFPLCFSKSLECLVVQQNGVFALHCGLWILSLSLQLTQDLRVPSAMPWCQPFSAQCWIPVVGRTWSGAPRCWIFWCHQRKTYAWYAHETLM